MKRLTLLSAVGALAAGAVMPAHAQSAIAQLQPIGNSGARVARCLTRNG